MSKEAKLVVEPRSEMGSAACRRLREKGLVPGNVYGHNAPATPVVVTADALRPIIKSGAHVVDLELSGAKDKAVIREVQWDIFGKEIRHVDLLRVDPNERVNITVPIELKGTAPGVIAGGLLEQPMHQLTIDCLAYQIPDSIQLRINALELGQAIHVKELELPEGCHPHAQPDAIVVHIIKVQERELVPAEGVAAEPEVIGKKPAEGEAADDKKDDKKKK
jgi:large subunit ribosomal protein L25